MRVVRVFVSSPGDCSTEREIVEEVVRRVNDIDGELAGLNLKTFAWENDVVPRIGLPPQKVVDDQTPTCDVFIGIMSGGLAATRRGVGNRAGVSTSADALRRHGAAVDPVLLQR
jgi:hypothetical protein